MTSFTWITASLGMILALGMTRLLTSSVALFRARKHAKLDWIPFVWAGCIFYLLLQFSWASQGLGLVPENWTFHLFLSLFLLSLILFLAAALVLPSDGLQSGEDLRESFESDGRWALSLLAGFEALSAIANWYFWNELPLAGLAAINGVLTALPLLYLLAKSSRKAGAVITILFAITTFSTIIFF
jgi:energy-converting hydrogenase Eha subunit A